MTTLKFPGAPKNSSDSTRISAKKTLVTLSKKKKQR
jgi:hypothetical protein